MKREIDTGWISSGDGGSEFVGDGGGGCIGDGGTSCIAPVTGGIGDGGSKV